ncbi:MAG: dTMP kinase [Candidatus Peribacteria bacterium]|nr:dTMP kinase [Candidatus Peribacteria bacterium]
MTDRFIVFEGPDGAGTTFQAKAFAERLEREGTPVLLTAEPSQGPIGLWIRRILNGEEKLPPSALQLLFCADRAWHVENVIQPALQEGKTVVSDRYAPSTLIYGEALGMDFAWLAGINRFFPKPAVTVFTLPPFEVCQERLARRNDHDLFEKSEFQKKIYDGYLSYAAADKSVHCVDTSGAKEEVAETIFQLIQHPSL